MKKLVVSARMTLDGVFDADTMQQWFEPYHSDERREHIKEVILASDALLVGRVTYEMLAAYWPTQRNNEFGIADRLNSMPKYVVSSTLKKAGWNNSTIVRENVWGKITDLKRQPGRDILTPGSAILVQSLMETDFIDEYQFLVHPIVMGSGKRFFKSEMDTTRLNLVETKTYSLGVMLLRYQPQRPTGTLGF